MSCCTQFCRKCCTLHICGKHPTCLRELTDARRAELLAGLDRSLSAKADDASFAARARRDALRERELAGWLRDFSGNGVADFEFTVESANEGLKCNLVRAERLDAARLGAKP